MLTLCMILALYTPGQASQPTVKCIPVTADMADDTALACIHDPMVDCSAYMWHEKRTMVLTIRRVTP